MAFDICFSIFIIIVNLVSLLSGHFVLLDDIYYIYKGHSMNLGIF